MSNDLNYMIEPDGSRSRKLIKPIRAHGEREIAIIRLRPPKYRDVMSFGDPSALLVMENAVLPHEDMAVIEKYIDTLATDETGTTVDSALLNQLDYQDALALKDAVMSFFKAASQNLSSTPQTL